MGPKPVAESPDPPSLSLAPGSHLLRPAAERAAAARNASEADEAPATPAAPLALPLVFRNVYEAELDFVWRSLLLLGVERNAVEDATQEVFSVVSRQLHRFEGRSSLRTWLFAILQRVAANQRRTRRRKQRPLEPLDESAVCLLPTPHARAEAAESIDLVQRYCDTLDEDRRALFVLALLEEVPAPEVSQALGIPVNTVYSRVRHLREGLRRFLDGDPDVSEVNRG